MKHSSISLWSRDWSKLGSDFGTRCLCLLVPCQQERTFSGITKGTNSMEVLDAMKISEPG